MPNYDNNLVKGTLFITVDVDFPRGVLSDEKKEGNFYTVTIMILNINHHIFRYCENFGTRIETNSLQWTRVIIGAGFIEGS